MDEYLYISMDFLPCRESIEISCKKTLYIERKTHSMHLDERELIHQLKKGSKEAFNQIYDMYARQLYVFCLQYTHSAPDAEEIVQDVFVRLWNTRAAIRHDETLRPLLFIMSKHLVINAFRTRVSSPVFEDYVQYTDMASAAVNPIDRLEYEEFAARLRAAIRRLPETQRKVIVLSRFKQLSHEEIAQKLGLSIQTVKNQLSLGLKALKQELTRLLLLLLSLLFVN